MRGNRNPDPTLYAGECSCRCGPPAGVVDVEALSGGRRAAIMASAMKAP
jgi:hypothetical protein